MAKQAQGVPAAAPGAPWHSGVGLEHGAVTVHDVSTPAFVFVPQETWA